MDMEDIEAQSLDGDQQLAASTQKDPIAGATLNSELVAVEVVSADANKKSTQCDVDQHAGDTSPKRQRCVLL